MSTNIKTINALKGLTCAIEHFKHFELVLNVSAQHPVQHLTNAATEIERLNNEVANLKNHASRLNESLSIINSDRELLMTEVRKTKAGARTLTGLQRHSVPDAVAAIKITEADREGALRTAEAFQKTRLTVEPTSDLFDAYARLYLANYAPTHGILSGLTARRPGKSTRAQYATISSEIIDEVIRASSIHPTWPTDAVHAVSILTEESGELMKAAIEYHYNNGDIEAVREEAVQTGAMALRVLMHIDKYKRPSDEK